MRKTILNEDYLPYNYTYIDDISEFVNLSKTILSKDTLYYPVFLENGLADLTVIKNKEGRSRFGKNSKTKYIKNLCASSHCGISVLFKIYQHNTNNNKYLLKSYLYPSSVSIIIEHTPYEIIKTYVYADGKTHTNIHQLINYELSD